MQVRKEWKVSWPRQDRTERRYSIKRDFEAALRLYHKMVGLKQDVEMHERKIEVHEWREIKNPL